MTVRLRRALEENEFLSCLGVWDAVSAKLVEKAGFPVIYAGGHVMAASIGYPDVGLVTMTEVVERARGIASAVNIPIICDADTGYGGIINVRRTIQEFERAGIAGCHIEDQFFPKKCGSFKGRKVIPKEEMINKIKAAVDARKDSNFFIIARTDSINIEGLDAAMERAKAYEQAGADAIIPQNAEGFGPSEMKIFNKKIKVPKITLITETDYWVRKHDPLSVQDGKKLGFKMAIFPLALMYSAAKAIKDVIQEIKEKGTTQRIINDKMINFDEFTTLMGLPEIYKVEDCYKETP